MSMHGLIRVSFLSFLVAMLLGCASRNTAGTWVQTEHSILRPPEPAAEFRAVWVASVANIDWPSEPGLSARAQRAEILRILDLCQAMRLNAVVLQIRPAADALYASRIEPWSEYLTGLQGKASTFDPLAYWIAEAHARAIDVHVWFNPFRARHPDAKSPLARSHIASVRPDLVRSYAGHLWLDPGEPEARVHSLRVIEDVLRRYDVDGVHLDDYFYPYPKDDAPFPDNAPYQRYLDAGGSLDRVDWRRQNIDGFVEELYTRVKSIKPHVLVGISPFGIWRPGHPEGVVGFDAYDKLSADSRLWLRSGWLDYASPQLYWPVDSAGQPFEPLLEWWASQNVLGRHLWPGLYLTRILPQGGWNPAEIERQIKITQEHPGAAGTVLFSMVGLLENRQGVSDLLASGVFAQPALIPSTNWLPDDAPATPRMRIGQSNQSIQLSLRVSPRPARWVVQSRRGGDWTTEILPGRARSHTIPFGASEQSVDALVVRAVSRTGILSEPAAFSRPISPVSLAGSGPAPSAASPRASGAAPGPPPPAGPPAASPPPP